MHLDSLSPRFGIRILMDTDRSNRSQVTIPHVKFAISHVTAFVGIAKDDGSPGSLFASAPCTVSLPVSRPAQSLRSARVWLQRLRVHGLRRRPSGSV